MTITELLSKFTEEDKKYLQQNAKNEKDFYDYFVTKGLTDSYEEFTAYLSQLKKLSSGEKELTDDQLKLIAGGWGVPIEDLDGGGGGGGTPMTLEDLYDMLGFNPSMISYEPGQGI